MHLNITLYLNCLSCFNVHHHHRHHYPADMELGHWLARSGMTHLGVPLNVSPGLNANVINLPKIILFSY